MKKVVNLFLITFLVASCSLIEKDISGTGEINLTFDGKTMTYKTIQDNDAIEIDDLNNTHKGVFYENTTQIGLEWQCENILLIAIQESELTVGEYNYNLYSDKNPYIIFVFDEKGYQCSLEPGSLKISLTATDPIVKGTLVATVREYDNGFIGESKSLSGDFTIPRHKKK